MQIVLKTSNNELINNIYNDEIWIMAQVSNTIFLPNSDGKIAGYFITSKSFLPNNTIEIGLLKTHAYLDSK